MPESIPASRRSNPAPPKSISGNSAVGPTTLTWSEALGKRVRTGDWADQAIPTVTKIAEAIASGHWELAAQLVDYVMEEAKVCHVVYQVWTDGFMTCLGDRVGPSERDSEAARLREVLAFPDGSPFEPGPAWSELGARAGRLANEIRGCEIDAAAAIAGVDTLREGWRQLHDRGADLMSGLLAFISRRLGEAAIGDCYESVLGPYLEERYRPFDVRAQPYSATLERNLYLSFESMRGHLCGPERTGAIDLTETDDAWVLRFDPCGSGGRGQRGDPVEDTQSRMDAPYDFAVTEDRHDWAGNERGVCLYCAHCVYALEYWPANEWGHPVRTVDPPLWPDEHGADPKPCSWTIWKDVGSIPDWAYARVGRTKPRET